MIYSLVFRYPIEFCGRYFTSLFQTKGDYSGWKRFAQMFNPFGKLKDMVISIGDELSMIPRCIVIDGDSVNNDSTAFVIVLLINSVVVNTSFQLQSFEDCTSIVLSLFYSQMNS